jgi:hypothetical protein
MFLSDLMCAHKAKFFHEAFGLEGEFSALAGWVTWFQQQYGIHEIAKQREWLHVNATVAVSFCT